MRAPAVAAQQLSADDADLEFEEAVGLDDDAEIVFDEEVETVGPASAGSLSSRSLTATTSPAIGEKSSDTAFTASIVPKTSCFPNFDPTFGSSM